MAPRPSSAVRIIVETPATVEETRKLFGVGVKRAAKIEKWAAEALAEVGGLPSLTGARHASKKRAEPHARKRSAPHAKKARSLAKKTGAK